MSTGKTTMKLSNISSAQKITALSGSTQQNESKQYHDEDRPWEDLFPEPIKWIVKPIAGKHGDHDFSIIIRYSHPFIPHHQAGSELYGLVIEDVYEHIQAEFNLEIVHCDVIETDTTILGIDYVRFNKPIHNDPQMAKIIYNALVDRAEEYGERYAESEYENQLEKQEKEYNGSWYSDRYEDHY